MKAVACLLFLFLGLSPESQADTLRLPAGSVAARLLGGPPACRISEGGSYRWEGGELLPLEGLFSFYTVEERPLAARISFSQGAERGEALRGHFQFDETLDGLEATLRQKQGDLLLHAKGFAIDEQGRNWCLLMGVPSTVEAGTYSMTVRGFRGRRFILYLADVEIRYKSFRSEEILFNRSLSELLTSPDPRKIEESRELAGLLASFSARSIFQTGPLSLPVESRRRTSGYADRRLYRYADGGSSRSFHNGIDLAAPAGTPVFASGAGRVVLARQRIMTGNSVVIEHLPGVFTLYYHLEEIEVREGQRLYQGQRIGTVGMSGLATGPHLHWELRVSGTAVDPDFFVSAPMIDKTVFSHNIIDRNSHEGG
jgi:hypothetical protein